MVCSPGGTTIEAVRVLEEKGFRAAVIEAMTKCMEKSENSANPDGFCRTSGRHFGAVTSGFLCFVECQICRFQPLAIVTHLWIQRRNPTLIRKVTCGVFGKRNVFSPSCTRNMAVMALSAGVPDMITANSSPPNRPITSLPRRVICNCRVSATIASSPTSWPRYR